MGYLLPQQSIALQRWKQDDNVLQPMIFVSQIFKIATLATIIEAMKPHIDDNINVSIFVPELTFSCDWYGLFGGGCMTMIWMRN